MRAVITLLFASWLWCAPDASADLADGRSDDARGPYAAPSSRLELHASQDESEKERLRRRLEKNRRHLRGEPVHAEPLPLSRYPLDQAVIDVGRAIGILRSEARGMTPTERAASMPYFVAKRDAIIQQINSLVAAGSWSGEGARETIADLKMNFPGTQ